MATLPPMADVAPATLLPKRVGGQLFVPLPTAALTAALAVLLWHVASQHLLLRCGSSNCGGGIGPLELLRPAAVENAGLNADEDIWPVSRALAKTGRCGTGEWQRNYTQMHASMLRGELEPRYLLASGKNGLADSLVGVVTLFYVAVLQQRAFFMDFNSSRGTYHWAFNSPNINWTWDHIRLEEGPHWRFVLDTHNFRSPQAVHIKSKDVRTFGSNYTTIAVRCNMGFVSQLLTNSYHKEELWAMGLHPNNIFACGLDYLLRLRPETLEPCQAQLAALQQSDTLKIGIQIRIGDGMLVKHRTHPDFAFYGAFFDCAAQIEAVQRRGPQQRVLYYLISDSVRLRRDAIAAFGDKIVTLVDVPIVHSRTNRKEDEADIVSSFRAAAAEMWLLSLTDYQVVSLHSGYGRVGVYASAKWQQSYGIDLPKDAKEPPQNVSCGRNDYLSALNI